MNRNRKSKLVGFTLAIVSSITLANPARAGLGSLGKGVGEFLERGGREGVGEFLERLPREIEVDRPVPRPVLERVPREVEVDGSVPREVDGRTIRKPIDSGSSTSAEN